MTSLPAFATTAFLLAMLPGPGQAVMTRQVLDHGRRTALLSTVGTGAGLLVWSVLAGAGVSATVLSHPDALVVLRWVGGALIAGIGVRTVLHRDRHPGDANHAGAGLPSSSAAFLTGLGTNLTNPKAGLFAIAVMPQFIAANASPLGSATLLGVVWALATMAWYVLFVWLVHRGKQLMRSDRARTGLSVTSGLALITIGLAIVLAG